MVLSASLLSSSLSNKVDFWGVYNTYPENGWAVLTNQAKNGGNPRQDVYDTFPKTILKVYLNPTPNQCFQPAKLEYWGFSDLL